MMTRLRGMMHRSRRVGRPIPPPLGFTLMEVLIALSLTSLLWFPTMLLYARQSRGAIDQALFIRAQGVAERGIESAQARPCGWISAEETVTDEGRAFQRTVTISLVAETLVRYQATVRWEAFGRPRRVDLVAYQQVQALPFCPEWMIR